MKKNFILLSIVSCCATIGFGQTDSVKQEKMLSVFNRISQAVQMYKPDTSAVPNDKITKKIIALRNLKGGFNINEAIDFKMGEDQQKNELNAKEFAALSAFFKTGNGKNWLDNAVIHIYRDHFSYKELKQLVRFYKTSAGKKMSADFAVIMLQSLAAAQMIKDNFVAGQQKAK
jgi:uncharacterized protein